MAAWNFDWAHTTQIPISTVQASASLPIGWYRMGCTATGSYVSQNPIVNVTASAGPIPGPFFDEQPSFWGQTGDAPINSTVTVYAQTTSGTGVLFMIPAYVVATGI